MVRVRYVGGATYALRGGPTWTDGDVHDVRESTAERLCADARFERVDPSGSLEPDSDASGHPEGSPADNGEPLPDEADVRADSSDDATELPPRDGEYVEDGLCGYYDADAMDSPCSRTAGWGRDADDGLCGQHAEVTE